MKCPKAKVKKRVSKTGKGNPSDFRSSIHGHSWKRDDEKTVCSLCGFIKKIHPKRPITTKTI
jgi:hypothetical protein